MRLADTLKLIAIYFGSSPVTRRITGKMSVLPARIELKS